MTFYRGLNSERCTEINNAEISADGDRGVAVSGHVVQAPFHVAGTGIEALDRCRDEPLRIETVFDDGIGFRSQGDGG